MLTVRRQAEKEADYASLGLVRVAAEEKLHRVSLQESLEEQVSALGPAHCHERLKVWRFRHEGRLLEKSCQNCHRVLVVGMLAVCKNSHSKVLEWLAQVSCLVTATKILEGVDPRSVICEIVLFFGAAKGLTQVDTPVSRQQVSHSLRILRLDCEQKRTNIAFLDLLS